MEPQYYTSQLIRIIYLYFYIFCAIVILKIQFFLSIFSPENHSYYAFIFYLVPRHIETCAKRIFLITTYPMIFRFFFVFYICINICRLYYVGISVFPHLYTYIFYQKENIQHTNAQDVAVS